MTASGSCVLRCIKTNSTMKRKVNISQLKIYNTPQKSFELANATSKDDESKSVMAVAHRSNMGGLQS